MIIAKDFLSKSADLHQNFRLFRRLDGCSEGLSIHTSIKTCRKTGAFITKCLFPLGISSYQT